MDLSQDTYIVITNLICIHLTQHGRQILTNIDKHRITSAIIIILANNRIIRNMIDLNYARNYIQSNLEARRKIQHFLQYHQTQQSQCRVLVVILDGVRDLIGCNFERNLGRSYFL